MKKKFMKPILPKNTAEEEIINKAREVATKRVQSFLSEMGLFDWDLEAVCVSVYLQGVIDGYATKEKEGKDEGSDNLPAVCSYDLCDTGKTD